MLSKMDQHREAHNHHLPHHHPIPTSPTPPYKPSVVETPVVMPGLLSPLSLPHGSSHKNHNHDPPPRPQPPWPCRNGHVRGTHVVYMDCLKNHAATLGGHALDGCGEFMTSPSSLACAACGCHRNFHRRRLLHSVSAAHHHRHREEDGHDEDGGDDDDDEGHSSSPPLPPQTPASNQKCSSAPHLLMTLSAGLPSAATALPRKRFRSKFSAEQKERMQELSERLGWRMQKRDEALIEERCKEIGVSRGVFKVWLHNNKHAFVGGSSSRRGTAAATGGGGAGSETDGYGGRDRGGGVSVPAAAAAMS